MENQPQTIAEVEALAAKVGITLTVEDYAAAHRLAEQRQRQLEAAHERSQTRISTLVLAFNRFYPKFLQTLLGIGDVLITATQTVLIAFGVPALLILLMIVEQQRVDHGIALFETTGALASFGATVLVLANLVFELLISWRENQAGYTEPPRHDFSLRILWQRVAYMMGRSAQWQPRPKSPAQRYKSVLRVITFAILVLALAGSMRGVIEQAKGNWSDALSYVATQSTLLQAFTWLGGLLFAFAAVQAAQAISHYVARKVIEIVAAMQNASDDKSRAIAEAAGLTAAMYLWGQVRNAQKQRRSVSAALEPSEPHTGVFRLSDSVSGGSEPTRNKRKHSPEMDRALRWLEAHPDSGLSLRAAAKVAGVSYSTLRRAHQRWLTDSSRQNISSRQSNRV
jgi:hypothetical protein